jgi:hypothetical protein
MQAGGPSAAKAQHHNDALHTALCCCRNFDKDHIDAGVMKKIQTYTPQPDFQPEKIEKVSAWTALQLASLHTAVVPLWRCCWMGNVAQRNS